MRPQSPNDDDKMRGATERDVREEDMRKQKRRRRRTDVSPATTLMNLRGGGE